MTHQWIASTKYRPFDKQIEAHQICNQYQFTLLNCGIRGGKTTMGAIQTGKFGRNSDLPVECPVLVVAPTYPMLRDVVIPKFMEMNAELVYDYNRSEKTAILETYDGKTRPVLFRSSEHGSFEKWRGLKPAAIWADEAALLSEEAADVIRGRVLETNAPCLFTTTPKGMNWNYDWFYGEKPIRNAKWVRWSSRDNPYVPDANVDDYEADMDSKVAAQEIYAQFVSFEGMVYFDFIHTESVCDPSTLCEYAEKHGIDVAYDRVSDRLINVATNNPFPMFAAIDFNLNPMSAAIVYDLSDDPKYPFLYVHNEFSLMTSDTNKLCIAIRENYPEIQITFPDPSGGAGSTKSGGRSDFDIIKSHGLKVRCRRPGLPLQKDRVNAVNRLIKNSKGERRLFWHPRCKENRRSFERTKWDPTTNKLSKKESIEHMSDALGYFIELKYPVKSYKPQVWQ